jgi:hypothetical protein
MDVLNIDHHSMYSMYAGAVVRSVLLTGKVNIARDVPLNSAHGVNPHFSAAFYCGGGSGHAYCVALLRAPQRTVEYACGALGRAGQRLPDAPCIHARLASSLRNLVRKAG